MQSVNCRLTVRAQMTGTACSYELGYSGSELR